MRRKMADIPRLFRLPQTEYFTIIQRFSEHRNEPGRHPGAQRRGRRCHRHIGGRFFRAGCFHDAGQGDDAHGRAGGDFRAQPSDCIPTPATCAVGSEASRQQGFLTPSAARRAEGEQAEGAFLAEKISVGELFRHAGICIRKPVAVFFENAGDWLEVIFLFKFADMLECLHTKKLTFVKRILSNSWANP